MKHRDAKLVYTSDPELARRLRDTDASASISLPPENQTIRISLDRKRRRGKPVTVASGFQLTAEALEEIAQQLKRRCGAGGTSKGDEIEIQGDHQSAIASALEQLGFRTRKT